MSQRLRQAESGDRVASLVIPVWTRVAGLVSAATLAALCHCDKLLHRHSAALWTEHRRFAFIAGRRSHYDTIRPPTRGYLAVPLALGAGKAPLVAIATDAASIVFGRCGWHDSSGGGVDPLPPAAPAARAARAAAGLTEVRLLCQLLSGSVAVVTAQAPNHVVLWYVSPPSAAAAHSATLPVVLDVLAGHRAPVRCLAALKASSSGGAATGLSPHLLVSSCRAGVVRCWDTRSGKCLRRWRWCDGPERRPCSALAVAEICAPDSFLAVLRGGAGASSFTSVGGDILCAFDVATGRQRLLLNGYDARARSLVALAVRPCGDGARRRPLVAAGYVTGALSLWDAERWAAAARDGALPPRGKSFVTLCLPRSAWRNAVDERRAASRRSATSAAGRAARGPGALCTIAIVAEHVVCGHCDGTLTVWRLGGDDLCKARCVQLLAQRCRPSPRFALFPAREQWRSGGDAPLCDERATLIVASANGGRISAMW